MWFMLFETGSFYVALAVLELCVDRASLKFTEFLLPLELKVSTAMADCQANRGVLSGRAIGKEPGLQ